MRYKVKRYDISADDKQVVIDAGDVVVGWNDAMTILIILKPYRGRI